MPWNLDCDPWVSLSFLQNNNHQAVKKNEMNRKSKKYSQKTVEIL